MLYRYMYLSSQTRPLSPEAMQAVLEVSRRNNLADGLTGLLLAHEGRFFQVIEGPRDAVYACLHRIRHDDRHDGIMRLDSGPVAERAFPLWRMGYAVPDDLAPEHRTAVFSIYDLARPGSTDRGTDPAVRAMIRNFLSSFRFLRPPRDALAS